MKQEIDFKINVDNTELEEMRDILSEATDEAEKLEDILNAPANTFQVRDNQNVYITINNFNTSHSEYLKD